MAITQTERLERETEETRAQVEQTLGELRARMSPGQLLDQAGDYFRNGSGRVFLGNLRDQVVGNPLPVTLIGAGMAWLAISGAIGRRTNGNGRAHWNEREWNERDWGETAARADDLASGGHEPTATRRARQAAEGWTSDAGDTLREGASDLGERAADAYDSTIGRARRAAEGWADDVRSAASEAGDSLRAGASDVGDAAAGVARGTRRMAHKAADYGRAARHAVEPNGALMNLCREQPMLVAGLGLAVGAALGALLPVSRPEQRIMGAASRDMRNQARDVANDSLRSAADAGGEPPERGSGSPDSAAADVDRGVEQAGWRSRVDDEPQSAAPYAETAEAGAAGPGSNPENPEAARNP